MKEKLKYQILTFIRYLGDGMFYPFFALYLSSRSINESKIGFLVAMQPFLAIILNPIYTKICSNIKKKKIVLAIASTLEGLSIVLLSFVSNYPLVLILVLSMAIFGCCAYSLMDSLLAEYSTSNNYNYSSIRMFGTGAYIIATTFGGIIVDKVNYQFAFSIAGACFILTSLFYVLVKDFSITSKESMTEESKKTSVLSLVKNINYVLFLLFFAITKSLIFVYNNFLSTYFDYLGISPSAYGVYYSIFVMVELVTLIVLTTLKHKINNFVLLMICAVCFTVRLLICYLNLPISLIIIATGLRGVSFAILLHVSYKYIIKLVGSEMSTKGIMLCELFASILLVIFNYACGSIIEKYSYSTFFFIGTIIAFITILIVAIMILINKKQKALK